MREVVLAIEDLLALVPPPTQPTDPGSESAKAEVEKRLGLPLPKDIYDYASRYGTGMFSDTLIVHNPFAPDYFDLIGEVSRCYHELKQSEGDAVIPLDVYPTRPGLLVCGSEVNGGMIFWLTDGEPDKWPLILMTVDFQFERRNSSLTTFLAQVFSGHTGCVLWDSEWVRTNLVGVSFRQTPV
jgi:hypothetical protein